MEIFISCFHWAQGLCPRCRARELRRKRVLQMNFPCLCSHGSLFRNAMYWNVSILSEWKMPDCLSKWIRSITENWHCHFLCSYVSTLISQISFDHQIDFCRLLILLNVATNCAQNTAIDCTNCTACATGYELTPTATTTKIQQCLVNGKYRVLVATLLEQLFGDF